MLKKTGGILPVPFLILSIASYPQENDSLCDFFIDKKTEQHDSKHESIMVNLYLLDSDSLRGVDIIFISLNLIDSDICKKIHRFEE